MLERQRRAIMAAEESKRTAARVVRQSETMSQAAKAEVYRQLDVNPETLGVDDPQLKAKREREEHDAAIAAAVRLLSREELKGSSAYAKAEMDLKRLDPANAALGDGRGDDQGDDQGDG